MAQKNFTLSNFLLICFCIGLIITIAIPYISRRRMENNEGAAIGSLRTISISQEQFKNTSVVDQDKDGSGEFGLLSELAGTASCRQSTSKIKQKVTVSPPFINSVYGPTGINNYSIKSGYCFQIYLPGTVTDKGTQGLKCLCCKNCLRLPNWLPAPCMNCRTIIKAQKVNYRLYAWPENFNFSGIRCFAINQTGIIMVTSNQNYPYESDHSPKFDAFITRGQGRDIRTFMGNFKPNSVAEDGQIWDTVENK